MDVGAAYARRSRRSRVAMLATVLATAIAVPATALTSSATPRSITVYVGTASGTSAAYRANGTGGAWTRKSSSDTPDAGGSAFPTLVDLDGDGVRDLLVGYSDGHVVAFGNAGSDGAPVWQREQSWDPQIDVGSMAARAR